MNKKFSIFLLIAMSAFVLIAAPVSAFNDLNTVEEADKVMDLKDRGIIQGVTEDAFAPDAELLMSQGITLIVKGMDLSEKLNNERVAYDHIKDGAWYASAFQIAAQNGLDIPTDIDPNKEMTKEEYTHYLFQAMLTTGDYAFPEIYRMFEDDADVTRTYMDSIQKMLIANIVSTDDEGYFHPKAAITRYDGAIILYNTLEFIESKQKPNPGSGINPDKPITDLPPVLTKDVSFHEEKVNEEVVKVVLSWGEQPNPGYGLSVDRIEFTSELEAKIYYQKHYPHPDRMYPQVIVTPTAETFVSSNYKISIHEVSEIVRPINLK